jgi:hypothetical protein
MENKPTLQPNRDIFLSHRSSDIDLVRKLATDIERETYKGCNLLTWLDEAEIRPGQSATGMINFGLENSRFIGFVMTPAYFQSESGWTDAEWHAALYVDPDNRGGRIIPLLFADCPYIPILLRHLNFIDFRGNRYQQALSELLGVLREEPLPRPITYRGQLVTSSGFVDRRTIVAERAVPQADPDIVAEKLYCNLLSVEKLPRYVYTALVVKALYTTGKDGSVVLPSKQKIKEAIRQEQEKAMVEKPFMPAFRTYADKIITFHDLESSDGPLSSVIEDNGIETIPIVELLRDEDDRKLVISLLNMAIDRYATHKGLIIDESKQGRFYFPPKNSCENIITWIPRKNKASRTVTKPYIKNGKTLFWLHLGAYLRILFLANNFYLKITPTWVITHDGIHSKGGPKVGQSIIKWTGVERNLQVLYHIRFWTTMLRNGPGPISIRAGDQFMEISTVPAFVQQSYGIAYDQKDLMGLLDQEASLIAEREKELVELLAEAELLEPVELTEVTHEGELTVEDIDEGVASDDTE